MRQAVPQKIPLGVLLEGAGYWNGMPFRTAITKLRLQYVADVESPTTV